MFGGKDTRCDCEFVTLADNCIIGTTTGITPGVQIDANTEVAPLSGIPKNIHLNANMIYEGLPVRRGSNKRRKSRIAHSMPVSVQGGISTTNTLITNRYLILHIVIMWLSLLPVIYILTGFILISNRSFEFVALFAALYLVSAYILFAFGSLFGHGCFSIS